MQYAHFAIYAIACAIVCSHITGIPITVQVYSVHCWPRKYSMSRFASADTLRPYRMSKADSSAGGHLSPFLPLALACPHSPAANDCRWVNADMALPGDSRPHDIAAVQCASK